MQLSSTLCRLAAPAALIALLASPGCDESPRPAAQGAAAAAAAAAPGVPAEEVLASLEDLMVTRSANSGIRRWDDVSISADGKHWAIYRHAPEEGRRNHTNYWVELDGVAGPMFDRIAFKAWSESGGEFVYVGYRDRANRGLPRFLDYFVVYGGREFGPFADAVKDVAVAPNGQWAAVTQGTAQENVVAYGLMLNARQVPMPPKVRPVQGTLRFDAAKGKFIYRAAVNTDDPSRADQWFDESGAPVPAPPEPPVRQPASQPAGLDVKVTSAGPMTARQLPISINGTPIGAFDDIVKARVSGGRWQYLFAQPDGEVIAYVIRNQRLIRLHLRPPPATAQPQQQPHTVPASAPAPGAPALPF